MIWFVFWGFPSLAMSRSSPIQFPQFVAWSIHTVVFLLIYFLDFVVLNSFLMFPILSRAAILSLSLLFLCIPWVLKLFYLCNPQSRWAFFLFLFLTHIAHVIALFIVFNFLVFCSICLSSLVVQGKCPGAYLFMRFFFTPWEFFTSALTDRLSLKFERQQISLNL